jgi:transcriptional regulator GlxA family with amidase domain
MDVPLQPFLENWRIRHACQLLKETNLSIKEIAASVGYSIPHSFIQAFKRQKNATPREYRFL